MKVLRFIIVILCFKVLLTGTVNAFVSTKQELF